MDITYLYPINYVNVSYAVLTCPSYVNLSSGLYNLKKKQIVSMQIRKRAWMGIDVDLHMAVLLAQAEANVASQVSKYGLKFV